MWVFFFSSRRRHTRCALVTGVQTCALPIFGKHGIVRALDREAREDQRIGLAITAFAERRAVFDTFVTDAPQEIAHVHRQRARQLGVGHQPLFPNVSRCSTIFSAASSGLMAVVSIRISGASGGS